MSERDSDEINLSARLKNYNLKALIIQVIVTILLAVSLTESTFFIYRDMPPYFWEGAFARGWTRINTFLFALVCAAPVGLIVALMYGARDEAL